MHHEAHLAPAGASHSGHFTGGALAIAPPHGFLPVAGLAKANEIGKVIRCPTIGKIHLMMYVYSQGVVAVGANGLLG